MKFLMDMIMAPSKGAKHLSGVSKGSARDSNHYIVNLKTGGNCNDNGNGNNEPSTQYKCCKYAPKVLGNLNNLRRNSRFCDVEIIAGGKSYKAHRAILAASSPYFHAMFTGGLCEQQQHQVELHEVAPTVLEQLLEFIYSGEIKIDQSNVQELMVASDMLELTEVVTGCTQYLVKELHPTNAIGIYRFSEAHNFKELSKAAIDYVHMYFPQVCAEDELLELTKDELARFLSSEHLRVDTEFQVLEAAVRWVMHDIVDRRRYVFEVLKQVRVPLLAPRLLERAIADCADGSLRVALRSVHSDVIHRRGGLVPLCVEPRAAAKKNIYVIGGAKREHGSGWQRDLESSFITVERFDTFRREWCRVSPMAISRILPGVAALNGRICVVGGEQESKILANGESYDPLEDKWSSISPMVVPRCEFGLCALDGCLYAMGGWVGEDIGDMIERYDPTEDRWTLVGTLPEPRFSMGVVSYEGLIYMVGGCTQHQRHLCDLLSYNPVTGEWCRLPPMSVARSQMGVAVLYGCLYVVGGTDKHSEVLNSVEKFSFEDRKWTTVTPMSVPRGVPAVAAADGLLYVMGGDQTRDVNFYRAQFTLNSVECYDPLTDVWRECPPLPESRAEAGACVV